MARVGKRSCAATSVHGPQVALRADLLATAARQGGADRDTAYARNGRSASRIRRILGGLKPLCASTCKRNCKTLISESELKKICGLYWSLSKEMQEYLATGPV